MPDVSVLQIRLYGKQIGALTRVQGDRNLFAFNQAYVDDAARPTLSLSFKDALGGLITELRPTQTRVPPFFANLLPEGFEIEPALLLATISTTVSWRLTPKRAGCSTDPPSPRLRPKGSLL